MPCQSNLDVQKNIYEMEINICLYFMKWYEVKAK